MIIKIYECEICKMLKGRGVRDTERFRGIRLEVRKHLRESHNLKGRKNWEGATKKELGQSPISSRTISREFK